MSAEETKVEDAVADNVETQARFRVADRVYAKDNETGLLYEATVRKALYGIHYNRQVKISSVDSKEQLQELLQAEPEPGWHYFVHYNGWNVKWDRWLQEPDLYEQNEATKRFAKRLAEEVKVIRAELRKRIKSGSKPSPLAVHSELEKRMPELERERRLQERREELKSKGMEVQEEDVKAAVNAEEERISANKKAKKKWSRANVEKEVKLRQLHLQSRQKQAHAVMLVLPFALKKILVEEWELITKCDMVAVLPSRVTVKDALQTYLQSKRPAISSEESTAERDSSTDPTANESHHWQEMVDGIALLFDQALPDRLLYPQERAQYSLLPDSSSPYSEIYGCEFLLRLFVQLPALLSESLQEAESRPIVAKMNDFVRYLHKNQATIFVQQLRKATDEEQRHQSQLYKSTGSSNGSQKRKVTSDSGRARKK